MPWAPDEETARARPDPDPADVEVLEPESGTVAIEGRLARNTVANIAGQVVTIGTWVVLTPLLLRHLGPTGYGLWVLMSSLLGYGGLLDLGVGAAVTKYVAEHRARGDLVAATDLVATALRLYTALGGVALLLGLALARVAPHVLQVPADQQSTLTRLVVVSSAALALQLPATLPYAVMRGLQRYDVTNLIGIAATALLAAGTVTVLLAGRGVVAVAAVAIPCTVVAQIPMVWSIHREAPGLRIGWRGARRALLRPVASFSAWLLLLNAASILKKKTDEVVIATVLPVGRIVPYAVARRLADLPELAAYQFVRTLMPLASHLEAGDQHERLRQLFVRSARLALAMFVPIAVAAVVLAEPLLAAWVGSRYATSAGLVVILVVAGGLEVVMVAATSFFQGIGRHRPLALLSASSALLNLVLSVILVRRFGLAGVAFGTLLATTLEVVIATPWALRVAGVGARAAVTSIFAPSLAGAVPCALVLLGLRRLLQPDGLVLLGVVGSAGVVAFAAGYLCLPATAPERSLVRRSAARPLAGLGGRWNR